jgi:hypothetical protein
VLLQGLAPLLERSARFVALDASARGAVEFDAEMWPHGEPVCGQAVAPRADTEPAAQPADRAEPAQDTRIVHSPTHTREVACSELEIASGKMDATRAELEDTRARLEGTRTNRVAACTEIEAGHILVVKALTAHEDDDTHTHVAETEGVNIDVKRTEVGPAHALVQEEATELCGRAAETEEAGLELARAELDAMRAELEAAHAALTRAQEEADELHARVAETEDAGVGVEGTYTEHEATRAALAHQESEEPRTSVAVAAETVGAMTVEVGLAVGIQLEAGLLAVASDVVLQPVFPHATSASDDEPPVCGIFPSRSGSATPVDLTATSIPDRPFSTTGGVRSAEATANSSAAVLPLNTLECVPDEAHVSSLASTACEMVSTTVIGSSRSRASPFDATPCWLEEAYASPEETRAEFRTKRTELDIAQVELEAARAEVETAQAVVTQARMALKNPGAAHDSKEARSLKARLEEAEEMEAECMGRLATAGPSATCVAGDVFSQKPGNARARYKLQKPEAAARDDVGGGVGASAPAPTSEGNPVFVDAAVDDTPHDVSVHPNIMKASALVGDALAMSTVPFPFSPDDSISIIGFSTLIGAGPHESTSFPLSEMPFKPPLSNSDFSSKLHERNDVAEIVDYEVCSTPSSIIAAVAILRHCPYIFLDCEGFSIGSEDGVLSIVSLGTPFFTTHNAGAPTFPPLGAPSNAVDTAQRIYLIDVLALDDSARAALAALLSADDIIKVVWDGRNDEIELREALGVGMTSRILDLQIVEVCGRAAVFGETNALRLRRIKWRAKGVVNKETKKLFLGMHTMLGMDGCIAEYMPSIAVRKDSAPRSLFATF